ncbi:hypothetical protein Tco_0098184 [Tanacetum coccineum]
MIDQGVTAALAARDANRNGNDSHTLGTGARRTERVARECTYQDFISALLCIQKAPRRAQTRPSQPKTMQEATEMATELMDKKISTFAERQAENKRKLDNNHQSQQHFQRGHLQRVMPEMKNRNHGNQAEGTRTHGMLHIGAKLQIVEEPVEIMDREVKRLKQSRFPLIKVRWNSKRGPEFTWEREDQFKKKYPHLFTKIASSSSAAS